AVPYFRFPAPRFHAQCLAGAACYCALRALNGAWARAGGLAAGLVSRAVGRYSGVAVVRHDPRGHRAADVTVPAGALALGFCIGAPRPGAARGLVVRALWLGKRAALPGV